MNTTAIILLVIFAVLAFLFLYNTDSEENFRIGAGKVYNQPPYYTTQFQAYPGLYMNFSDDQASTCLQRNHQYPGFRNCMLYNQ